MHVKPLVLRNKSADDLAYKGQLSLHRERTRARPLRIYQEQGHSGSSGVFPRDRRTPCDALTIGDHAVNGVATLKQLNPCSPANRSFDLLASAGKLPFKNLDTGKNIGWFRCRSQAEPLCSTKQHSQVSKGCPAPALSKRRQAAREQAALPNLRLLLA